MDRILNQESNIRILLCMILLLSLTFLLGARQLSGNHIRQDVKKKNDRKEWSELAISILGSSPDRHDKKAWEDVIVDNPKLLLLASTARFEKVSASEGTLNDVPE